MEVLNEPRDCGGVALKLSLNQLYSGSDADSLKEGGCCDRVEGMDLGLLKPDLQTSVRWGGGLPLRPHLPPPWLPLWASVSTVTAP